MFSVLIYKIPLTETYYVYDDLSTMASPRHEAKGSCQLSCSKVCVYVYAGTWLAYVYPAGIVNNSVYEQNANI